MKYRVAVVDTNVVVAGLLTHDLASPTARILDQMLLGQIPFVVSSPLLAEYRQVLLRERIQTRHGLDEDEIDHILTTLVANAIVREPSKRGRDSPSEQDQHLWDLLSCESGSILVTGDRLLMANPPVDVRVVSPAEFLNR